MHSFRDRTTALAMRCGWGSVAKDHLPALPPPGVAPTQSISAGTGFKTGSGISAIFASIAKSDPCPPGVAAFSMWPNLITFGCDPERLTPLPRLT